ncbi:unnamed protein product [Adineta steineri]|nr:unnamed protein product [Adineta steineri]
MWITFTIIVLVIIITIPIVIVKTKKTSSEKTSVTEERTIEIKSTTEEGTIQVTSTREEGTIQIESTTKEGTIQITEKMGVTAAPSSCNTVCYTATSGSCITCFDSNENHLAYCYRNPNDAYYAGLYFYPPISTGPAVCNSDYAAGSYGNAYNFVSCSG